MTQIAVVYHSGYGHTEVIAKAVAEGAEQGAAKAVLIKISPEGKIEDAEWATLEVADAIIFGAPTYMGMVSGPFKMFADASSKPWFHQKWKDKLAGGFTNSGSLSGDKLASLQYLAILAAQHGMLWVSTGVMGAPGENHQRQPEQVNRLGSWLGVMAQSDNGAPSETPPQGDKDFGAAYGKRIAEFAVKLNK